MTNPPIAFLISWTCYGQWLHGDDRGSVDPEHHEFGQPWLAADHERWAEERSAMNQPPYSLDVARRRIVKDAIVGVCRHRGWTLHALHVRALHVHAVVSGESTPERMMNDFKSYASRALNAAGFESKDRKRWTRHGSTRHIHDTAYLSAATNYVLNKQGAPMERYPEPLPDGRGSEDGPNPTAP
jgi:REP element-mobilizing transposase RayT